MKKMTLAQKKQRLKEIKEDWAALPSSLKREPKWVQDSWRNMQKNKKKGKPGYVLTKEREKEIRERAKRVQMMLVRPRVPADELPGEWVKLPPMKWPETLPVEVPLYKMAKTRSRSILRLDTWAINALPEISGIVHAIFYELARGTQDKKALQSAWSETLVRLGYTEDA